MQIFKKKTEFDFMGKRKVFAYLSASIVAISLLAVFVMQPKFGIDFVGGTEIQIKFQKKGATVAHVRSVLQDMGFDGVDVVSFGTGETEYLVRLKEVSRIDENSTGEIKAKLTTELGEAKLTKFELSPGGDKLTVNLDRNIEISQIEEAAKKAGLELSGTTDVMGSEENTDAEETARKCERSTCTWPFKEMQVYEISLAGVADQVMTAMREQPWGEGATKMRSEWVGAKVGSQLRNAGASSILYALLFIMVYIAFRFDLRFAPGAVVALIHDIIITLGIFTIFKIEVTLATVAALLTIVGYSLNDTIVVFDRIRENMSITREIKLSTVINTSLNETLSRTILTSVTTLLAVVVLLTIGWKTSLRDFSFALVVGVVVGTYSSLYVASPVVVWLDRFLAEKKA